MQPGGAEANVEIHAGRPRRPLRTTPVPAAEPVHGGQAARAEAAARCDRLLRDTLDAVRPELAWREGPTRTGTRLLAPGSGPDDGAVHWYVARSLEIVTVISPARRPELPGMVAAAWQRRGWRLTSVNAGRPLPGLAAVTPDGYRLGLEFGPLGQARLTAVSPGAAARPGWSGEAAGGAPLPGAGSGTAALPRIRCAFWSALG
ncbi:hypothetical protein [Kitasatospora sp. A2-31]|uniref:hypothetical protein n=1 Tax=Kitasatospora sp. A2-31 TaxID=2916414 RepID=UPI001EECA974|nr:hypothetical protein [Kitasatospora sp. A2-31]MCG6494543.1 hypothetical protein [Kitasatospora sp. A2-31]